MSLSKPKHIENTNIPWPLAGKANPSFYIYKVEEEKDDIRLYYQLEDAGFGVYFDSRQKFNSFPNEVEVISGGWYGNEGRWSPLERYVGTIICKNVSSIKKHSSIGKNYKFSIKTSFWFNTKTLTIESEPIGIVEIKCKAIIPQQYSILLFSKINGQWQPREELTQ